MITTQRELRAEFWRQHPRANRKKIKNYSGTGWMYHTDTRVMFCDWLDHMCRSGEVSEALAERATLSAGSKE